MAEYNARIKHKRDTDVNWADADPVLLNGEIIVVDTMDGHVRKKVGDGIQRYSHLPFDDEQLAGVVQSLTNDQKEQARANIGAGQPVFAVNVTKVSQGGGYTADKTAAEIEAAYQAGRTIVCKTQAEFWIASIPVELPLVSRNQERVFIFAVDQLMGENAIFTITVNISDSGVEANTREVEIYKRPADGIPKSDLAEDVQTSLAKADTAISLGLTSATPGQIIKVKTVQDGKPTEWEAVDDRLPKVSASDAGNVLGVEQIGEFEYGYALTHMPTLSDFIPLGITNASPGQFAKVSFVDDFGGPTAWEAADIYEKPTSGIPKTDLADDVQISLNLAGTALQAVPGTYRTAAAQDELDMAKQPKAITDVGGYFGENPTVESALQQIGGALILRTWTD